MVDRGVALDMISTAAPNVESMFQSLVGNLPAAVYRCAHDADWTMEYVSDYIEVLTGYPAHDYLVSRTRILAIHPDDSQYVIDEVGRAVEANLPFSVRYRVVHADGSIRRLFDSGVGVCDDDGNVVYLDGALFDETEQHQREEKIAAQYVLLEDIATYGLPKLNRYVSSLQEQRDDKAEQAGASQPKQARSENIQQLQNLMGNIISLTLSGRTSDSSYVDMVAVLMEVKRGRQSTIAQTNAMIKSGDLPKVHFNAQRLKSVLSQLLDNSIKFNAANYPDISIQAEISDGRATISIADNGIGFDRYFLENAFDLGSRGQNALAYPGDGFGLAVCKSILDAAGEEIWIDPDTQTGSRVCFTLPVAGT